MPFSSEDADARQTSLQRIEEARIERERELEAIQRFIETSFPSLSFYTALRLYGIAKQLTEAVREQYRQGKDTLRATAKESSTLFYGFDYGLHGWVSSDHEYGVVLTAMAMHHYDVGQEVRIARPLHGRVQITCTAPLPPG